MEQQQREWITITARKQLRAHVLARVLSGEVKLWEAAVVLGLSVRQGAPPRTRSGARRPRRPGACQPWQHLTSHCVGVGHPGITPAQQDRATMAEHAKVVRVARSGQASRRLLAYDFNRGCAVAGARRVPWPGAGFCAVASSHLGRTDRDCADLPGFPRTQLVERGLANVPARSPALLR